MKLLPLRFPGEEINPRVEKLLEAIRQDADFRSMKHTTSSVVRMALFEGLEVLEKRFLKDR